MALTPAQRPGRMPARRLVWMTGLMFQTRLQENPNPMAFKGRAGGGPLAMPGMRESPRHGRGVSRGSDLPPSWGKGGNYKQEGKRHFTKLRECRGSCWCQANPPFGRSPLSLVCPMRRHGGVRVPASRVRVKNTSPSPRSVPGFQASGINFQVSFPSPGSGNTLGFPPSLQNRFGTCTL